MEYPVIDQGVAVGSCSLLEEGLYWRVVCRCRRISNQVERLWSGDTKIGVLLLDGDELILKRRLSKAAYPCLPPEDGVFTLAPVAKRRPWSGSVLGYHLPDAVQEGNHLLFPYEEGAPCPCPALFCFFSIQDGFWCLPLPDESKNEVPL